jgi:hypothetical protein
VKQVFEYLNATKRDDLTYWRPTPRMDLPIAPDPFPISALSQLDTATQVSWAMECIRNHRVLWYEMGFRPNWKETDGWYCYECYDVSRSSSILQPMIAKSSTEAEFTNMADAGKVALYLRYILEEIGIIMDKPTPNLADNQGAVRLANAHQPTRRMRHVEMKHFIILQWTDDYSQSKGHIINYVSVSTYIQF